MSRQSGTAVIGGSGFYTLNPNAESQPHLIKTPYAEAPVVLYQETFADSSVWFLPRHGKDHAVPPHRINYRANIFALKQMEIDTIISVNAVGGIHQDTAPGTLIVPDQIIDYTWGREHTFFDGPDALENHVDFTDPFHPGISQQLLEHCETLGIAVKWGGVYGCTQGPRLETAAEINRMRRDGCAVVGMTAMPEAALARELGLDYVSVAMVVNWAAGVREGTITLDEIRRELEKGVEQTRLLLEKFIGTNRYADEKS